MKKITGENLTLKYTAECDCGATHEVKDIRAYHPREIVKGVCDFCKEEFCSDCENQLWTCVECEKKYCEQCTDMFHSSNCPDCVKQYINNNKHGEN